MNAPVTMPGQPAGGDADGPDADLLLVDVDTHITEWADLWTARATPAFRDRVPRVELIDGKPEWVMDGHRLAAPHGFSAIRADGSKMSGNGFRDTWHEAITPGAYSVRERLAYMDREGIAAQIGYTNLLGFGGQKAMLVDPELRLVATRLLNDAMAEFQAESGNRIFPMIMMPWWDVTLCVAEAARGADMGLRGINMNSDPHVHGLPPLGDRYWDPLWEVCTDRHLPVNFHIGASDDSMTWFGTGQWPGFSNDERLAFGSTMMFVSNMRVLGNILMSRFLERWPALSIVSVESGAGWLPFMLEALEYQMAEAGLTAHEPIRDVFHRQIYGTVWFEQKTLSETVRQLGAGNVMVETDYPHPTCLYPGARAHLAAGLADLPVEDRRKVMGGTAQRIYALDIGAA
ncbi:amidohydrolase family protein [Novosphingobium bradum]|uniref:Amidohydrolase family protein n=1 Tax=Novosphingobium bradum TaxID=1737444 RepID=A0ABV7IL12_9SPHN